MPGPFAISATVKLVAITSSIGLFLMSAPVREVEGVGALSVAHAGCSPSVRHANGGHTSPRRSMVAGSRVSLCAAVRSAPHQVVSGRVTCSGGGFVSLRRVAAIFAPGVRGSACTFARARGVFFNY